MKKLIILTLLLSGCSIIPIQRNFPEVPKYLTEQCADLSEIKENEKQFSNVLVTIVGNYSTFHQCKLRNDMWNEWYKSQKKIFEELR